MKRRLARWRRRPVLLALITLAYLAWSLVPVLLAVRFSFNDGRSRSSAQGWSTRWYWGDPDLSVWRDPDLRSALLQSLRLAGLAIVIAVPLGVGAAIGITRWRGRAAKPANLIALSTLVTPEIVMGSALLLVFVNLLTFVPLGTMAQLAGHVTFSLAFVLLVVRGRLVSIGREYEEAAMDLGASSLRTLRSILLPLLSPAIVASAIVVFALSMDDFVVSAFLSAGAGTDTVPVRIYSNARGSPTPALNALASLTLFLTLAAVALAFVAWQAVRRRGGERGSAVRELARLEL
ncbi:MAG: ABC transporter permease [Thermoleophilia bacterium]|nr:ABC transporter permease [Thermoleophilia bacterium]